MNLSLVLGLLITLFSFLTFVVHPRLTAQLPECGHIVLVSAARHGSSWFLDSAEGCPSRGAGNYGKLIRDSELWTMTHSGAVADVTPLAAVEYAMSNNSLKVFPNAFKRAGMLQEFFNGVRDSGIPVFVLNRKLGDSFGSLKEAIENNEWNSNVAGEMRERKVVGEDDEEFLKYQRFIGAYFKKAEKVMRKAGVQWDRLDYEDVKEVREIVGQRNRCYISNCNFV